jgi:hypothetical protein
MVLGLKPGYARDVISVVAEFMVAVAGGEAQHACRPMACLCNTHHILPVATINYVATVKGLGAVVAQLVAAWCSCGAVPVFNANHELCRYTDDVTQH